MNDIPKPPTAPPKAIRTRSPGYPMFSLKAAVEGAEKIWKAQNKHAAHIDSVVRTMGYTKLTGPALRAISALDQYGLTTETGSGDKRNVALSDLALDILIGDEEQKRTALRRTAIKPTIFGELWQKYGERLPDDAVINTFLLREKNFNPGVVGAVVSDYRATIDYAKLRGNVNDNAASETGNNPAPAPDLPTGRDAKPLSRQSTTPPMTQNVRYLSIPLDIGDAPVPLGMSKDDWKIFIDALRVFKSRIVKDADDSQDAALDDLAK